MLYISSSHPSRSFLRHLQDLFSIPLVILVQLDVTLIRLYKLNGVAFVPDCYRRGMARVVYTGAKAIGGYLLSNTLENDVGYIMGDTLS